MTWSFEVGFGAQSTESLSIATDARKVHNITIIGYDKFGTL